MDDDEVEVLLLVEAHVREEEVLREARREVFSILIEEAWRTAMRSRHYLTGQCLDPPQ